MTGDVFDRLAGQEAAADALRWAAVAPVHAYLFVGPPGSGRRRAALAFAAAVLCADRGCGACEVCRRVLAGSHPDVLVVERTGASISMPQAQEIRRVAMRTPNEATHKVLVLTDFQAVAEAGPALLKILEEPPPSTVFVVVADHVPPELVTIASRCVVISFGALPGGVIAAALVAEGIPAARAEAVAGASGGRLDRARLLAEDPDFVARAEAWRAIPSRLDGTGATAWLLAAELAELLAGAAVGPLEARHRAELAEVNQPAGGRGKGRSGSGAATRELAERHKRELRRLRTDELRFGLATLAGAYRDALIAGAFDPRPCAAALDALQAAAESLVRNPSESLLLQALLLRLAPLPDATARAG